MTKQVVISKKPDITDPIDFAVLSQFVRHKRTSLDMTLEDAASLCNLSKQAYSNVEKGISNIRVETLFKVLVALGIALSIVEQGDGDDW